MIADGPRRARAQLILAHGSGAGMSSDFMTTIATGIAEHEIRVIRFEFPYMQAGRKLPDRLPVLAQAYRDVIAANPHAHLFIGGKSLGGRVAATIAAEGPLDAHGVICLGYPFHPPGQPDKLRLDPLTQARLPVQIVQGTRDPFGSRPEVAGYKLPRKVKIAWVEGDHSFEKRLDAAVAAVVRFIDKVLGR